MKKEEAKEEIKRLIRKYEQVKLQSQKKRYDEANTRKDFIMPFFKALGWDVYNDFSREVVEEETAVKGKVDYSFRISNIPRFLLEAKALKEDLDKEQWTKQAVTYSWNKGIPWAVLTDFEGLKLFNADWLVDHPVPNIDLKYDQYLDKFDKLWLLSKESISKGELDQRAEEWGIKAKRLPVGKKLADDLIKWRGILIENFRGWNGDRSLGVIEESVQRVLDRLIFIRAAEDRQTESRELWEEKQKWEEKGRNPSNFMQVLRPLFEHYDKTYNSNLFTKHTCEELDTEGGAFVKVIDDMYANKEKGVKYDFSAIDADVLGNIYEQYLGTLLEKSETEGARDEYKKRKKQGIYYTPTFIVDYIVRNTLGEVLKERSLAEIKKLKVLDPACGSGSFLIKAFDILDEEIKNREGQNKGSEYNALRKMQILTTNLYGVDLDNQAIEIARLNLLLKALEPNFKLPMLTHNTKVGNSLISGSERDLKKCFGKNWPNKNPLDWQENFPEVFQDGGFDIIVGNPPYGASLDQNEKRFLKDWSQLSDYQLDTYILFIERSLQLLKPLGILGLIVPNTWLTNIKVGKLRGHLVNTTTLLNLTTFSDKIFPGTTVDNVILILRKEPPNPNQKIKISLTSEEQQEEYEILQKEWTDQQVFNIHIRGNTRNFLAKIKKEAKDLDNFCFVTVGIKPYQVGKGTPAQTRETVNSRVFDAVERKEETHRLYLRGRDIGRYKLRPNLRQWLSYGPWLAEPRQQKLFDDREKILMRQTGDSLIATLDTNQFLCLNNMHTVNLKKDTYNIKFFLALLNSKLLDFYYQSLNPEKGEALAEVKATNVKRLPIKELDFEKATGKKIYKDILEKVDKMLSLNKKNLENDAHSDSYSNTAEEVKKTDKEIDQLVYKHYDLTSEEVAVVEAETLSRS